MEVNPTNYTFRTTNNIEKKETKYEPYGDESREEAFSSSIEELADMQSLLNEEENKANDTTRIQDDRLDSDGNKVGMYDITYDENGNIIRQKTLDKDYNVTSNEEYTYNDEGEVVKTKIYNDNGTAQEVIANEDGSTTTVFYDKKGRKTAYMIQQGDEIIESKILDKNQSIEE
jgi:hypothetical protein